MNTRWKLATVLGCILFSALPGSRTSLADTPSAGEAGVWQKHEYSFTFLGFTSTYSCDGLASKLRLLLIASGARHDAKARAGACASGFGRPDKFARADLTFYTLAPGQTGAVSGATPIGAAPVDGIWQPVSLADRSPRELSTGDCELVDQFRTAVLPMFTTRNIDNNTTCVPHQISGSVINLKFESFSAPRLPRTAPSQQGGS
jgi:hypothetical protein